MTTRPLVGLRSGLAWLVLPLVPAVLGDTYHRTLNITFGHRGGPDPRDWAWPTWLLLMGPLVGYGFLAGATAGLPDGPGRPGVRGWLSGRSFAVGVGPWAGFLAWSALVLAAWLAVTALAWAHPASREWSGPDWGDWWRTWPGWLLGRVLMIGVFASAAYGWLVVGYFVLRRAGRLGSLGRSIRRGLAVAIGFVGSLIGSFWTITEVWRAYFFDPRTLPILLAASTLVLTAGCAPTETYGEIRRRELFQAMLMAWLIGLAIAWRWWGRTRSRPRGPL